MNLPQYTPESWILYYLPDSENKSFGRIIGGQLLEENEEEEWMYFVETPFSASGSYTTIYESNVIALADTKNGQWDSVDSHVDVHLDLSSEESE